jgi:cell division protein FtsW (lipid II flippase)
VKYSDKIDGYVKTVCEQMRWKRAHETISKEIQDHIVDQTEAFIEEGFNEQMATEKAIEEMGDPVEVGLQFDRVYKPRVAWNIVVLTSILLLIGVFAKTWVSRGGNMPPILTNSFLSMLLGMGCMIAVYFFDFTTIGKYPRVIYFSMLGIGSIVMLTAPVVNGRTLYAYNVLLLLPMAFAGIVYKMRTKGYKGIVLSCFYFILPLGMAPFMSNSSAFILYIVCGMILMTTAILKGWFGVSRVKGMLLLYIPGIGGVLLSSYLLISMAPYRLDKLKVAMNLEADTQGVGYVANIIRRIVSEAKVLGQSEWAYSGGVEAALPEIHTNTLLAYLIQQFGWISFIMIIAVMLVLGAHFFLLYDRQKSVLGKLVGLSILATFMIQILFYVIYNLGFSVIAPLTLPLISYGNVATVVNMTLIGVMLSLFNTGRLLKGDAVKGT